MLVLSIYKKSAGDELNFGKIKKVGLIVLLIVVVLGIIYLANLLFVPKNIEWSFSQSEWNLDDTNSVVLNVVVRNFEARNVENVIVVVKPVAGDLIGVFPERDVLSVLGSNESRKFSFRLFPLPKKKLKAGEYSFDIAAKIGEKVYSKAMIKIVSS